MAEPSKITINAGTNSRDKVVLLSRQMLSGATPAGSILKGTDATRGALVESERYAEFCANKPNAHWASDGLVQLITVRDLRIEGGQKLDDRTWLMNMALPDVADGVRFFAGGVEIDKVKVSNFRGAAVRLRRGGGPRSGEWQSTDWEATKIGWLEIAKCFDGLVVEAGADGVVDYLEAGGMRNRGLWLKESTGNWLLSKAHLFGCDICVLTQGGAHEFSILETETGRVGWVNEAEGTSAETWTAFGLTEACGQWKKRTSVTHCKLTVSAGLGVDIQEAATASSLAGKIAVLPGAVGVKLAADKTRLTLDCWGGGKVMEITRPVAGCEIDLTTQGGDVGVNIVNGLGVGTHLRMKSNGCAHPVTGTFDAKQVEVIAL